ncbi:MAG TPA: ABC transporter ATP-binding protein [Geminicoccus sp.]|uniref:ABC transporter ATP-binding protein n=1 Tax=Geminicoccus sp. TaxID=2024832 RepID=UPI002E340E52|nr:ABC transporter ATP-binding protein [Geminicoccus sp.]HEX2529543.1 ABC transporter ATP-binding protein [Geminicoccus sp.]
MLQVHGLTKKFGGVAAVDGISFTLSQGTITGLIGPNGAGKTTLFNLIAGMYGPSSGTLSMNGQRIERRRQDERTSLGIGRTFQIPRPFPAMSVVDNVMVASGGQSGERFWRVWTSPRAVAREESDVRARAHDWLRFVGLDHMADQPARTLSGGQRKLLELARVMMVDPRLVLLDEPGAGVAPPLMKVIVDKIRELNARGVTFLIIEHDMDLVMSLCRPILVMAQGKLLMQGSGEEIRRDARVIDAYLGGTAH